MIWIILGLIIVYAIGFVTSAWHYSDKIDIHTDIIHKQDKVIEIYKTEIINLQNEVQKYKNSLNSYPTYSSKV